MKKIGIVTSARELNYGAILQAYALQRIISDFGFDSKLLWWSNQRNSHRDIRIRKLLAMFVTYVRNPGIMKKSVKAYGHTFEKSMTQNTIELFEKFENEFLNIEFLTYGQMKHFALSEECRAVIAGSDQIWNSYAIYVDPFYYLQFAPKNKRIAYAPSLGKNDIPDYNKQKIKRYVNEINHLSVREETGRTSLSEIADKKIEVVLDPSLLLDSGIWKTIEGEMSIPKEYILLYFLDQPNIECVKKIKEITERFGLPVLALPYEIPSFSDIENIHYVDAGPAEFLSLIDNANLILTDSFHGTAFSINYNKTFLTFDRQYGNNQSQASRIVDLLSTFELTNHFISGDVNLRDIDIDYTQANNKLELLRDKSIRYLKDAIEDCK